MHTMDYYAIVRNNAFKKHRAMRVDLKSIMLSQMYKTKQHLYHNATV